MISTLIVALSLSGAALQEPPNPKKIKVSYTTEGASVRRVFDDLSRQTGFKLSSSTPFQEMPLVLDTKDVPLRELMDKIAQVVHATWKEEREGWWLVQSPEFEKRLSDEFLSLRTEEFRKGCDELGASGGRMPALTQTTADVLAQQTLRLIQQGISYDQNETGLVRSKLPVQRLAKRLIGVLPIDLIARLHRGRRMVFTTEPNAMQKALPKEAKAIIAEFAKEQSMWAKSLASFISESAITSNPVLVHDTLRLADDRFDPTTESFKVLVSVRADTTSDALSFTVKVLDSGQKVRSEATERFGYQWDQAFPRLPESNGPGFEFNSIVQEFERRISLRTDSKLRNWVAPSPELRERLLNPEKYDFFGLGTGSLFIQTSRAKGLQLAACPVDYLLYLGAVSKRRNWTPATFFDLLMRPTKGPKWTESDSKWLTVSWRVDPVSDYQDAHVSRRFSGEFLRGAERERRITLEAQAQAAQLTESPHAFLDTFLRQILRNPDAGIELPTHAAIDLLRLHGLLTPEQRGRLANGSKLRPTEMSPSQQKMISKILFDDEAVWTDNPNLANGGSEGSAKSYPATESTELFPSGLPNSFFLTMRTLSEGMVQVFQTNGDSRDVEEYTYQEFASYLNIQAESGMYDHIKMHSFRATRETRYAYRFEYAPSLFFSAALKDLVPASPWVDTFEQLPKDVISEIRRIQRRLKPPVPTLRYAR